MNEIQFLASQVRAGDPIASGELRSELESKLAHVVRRTLRTRSSHSSLSRRILAETDRLALANPSGTRVDREWLVATVCRRMCDIVIEQIDPARAPGRAALETVCD